MWYQFMPLTTLTPDNPVPDDVLLVSAGEEHHPGLDELLGTYPPKVMAAHVHEHARASHRPSFPGVERQRK